MKSITIRIPNQLSSSGRRVEWFYKRMSDLIASTHLIPSVIFDMEEVRFLNPYGILSLVMWARHLTEKSRQPVKLTRLVPAVCSYLERVDLVKVASQWIEITETPLEPWDRKTLSANVLEVTCIEDEETVYAVADRIQRIFHDWQSVPKIVTTMSELCSNV